MAEEEEFEDFGGKKGKKMDKDTVEIKIRFNKFWLERVIYIVIILILTGLIFYNPFGKYKCEKGLSEIISEPVVAEPEPEATEPVVEEEPEAEPEPEPESGQKLSGEVVLTIDTIQLDENNTKVESITVKIDNQKKAAFSPLLKLFWYDDKDSAVALKPRNSINYTGAIPLGTVKVWKLDDELKARYLDTENPDKEFFKIELYDMSDPAEAVDTKTKSINT